MKVNIQKGFFALLMLLILSSTAKSQEFIKIFPLQKSQDMIVRDYTGDKWVIYDRYLDNYLVVMQNVFLLVSENGASAPMLILPSSIKIVNDFEIFKDEVYFCGQDINNRAVMGRFSLQNFQNSQVCVWTLPEMYSFNKLDVGELNSTYHVMMTGEAALGSSHIVDAKRISSTQWDFNISKVLDDWLFDDVAITTSKVAFSARQKKNNIGTLIEFPYPAMSLFIIPSSTVSYVNLYVSDGILLKATTGDQYAYLTNSSNSTYMGEALGLTKVWEFRLGSPTTPYPYYRRDITYNPLANRVDILGWDSNHWKWSILHGFNPGSLPLAAIYGHEIGGHTIRSLDGIKSANGLFIATGNAVTADFLTLYRYKYDIWPGCLEQTSINIFDGYPWQDIEKIAIYSRVFSKDAECVNCEIQNIGIYSDCEK